MCPGGLLDAERFHCFDPVWTIASPAIAGECKQSGGELSRGLEPSSRSFTLQAPTDVNVAPLCTDLALPLHQSENCPRPWHLRFPVPRAYAHDASRLLARPACSRTLCQLRRPRKEGRQDNYVRLLLAGVRGTADSARGRRTESDGLWHFRSVVGRDGMVGAYSAAGAPFSRSGTNRRQDLARVRGAGCNWTTRSSPGELRKIRPDFECWLGWCMVSDWREP